MTVPELRWPVLLGTTLAVPALCGAVLAVVFRPAWFGALVALVAWLPAFLRARRRRLVVSASGWWPGGTGTRCTPTGAMSSA